MIQDHIKKPLADEILFGKLKNGGTVTVGWDKDADKLTFDYHAAPPAPNRQAIRSRMKQ